MRRLEHLAGVEGIGVGVVIVQARSGGVEDGGGFGAEVGLRGGRKMGEAGIELALGFVEALEEVVGWESDMN